MFRHQMTKAGLSVAFALGIALAGSAAATASPHPVSNAGGGSSSMAAPSGHSSRAANPGNGTSTNWSGEVFTDASFTSVTSSWTVPKLSCPSSGFQSSYFWVGLGGWNGNRSLEQLGTAQWCNNGAPHYGLFAEFWSNPPIAGDGGEYPGYPVKPGDTVTATVSKLSNGKYRIYETSSRGWTYSQDGNAPGNDPGNLTAEVIAEAPGDEGTPLANFGTGYFNNIVYYADQDATSNLYDIKYNNVLKDSSSYNNTANTYGIKVGWLHS
ncbi:G1 family glutamic endopeptidase [Psychromicrobium lacuslunae]|uniref:G1 family glutamic endopeptidase n=1 Tax=Psychromicrobium lacuslunae TaxID=1618207 RepID=UPI0009E5276C|nr:G1 family glutamic endopeptidase [Psychromicrobium lacuslunae]